MRKLTVALMTAAAIVAGPALAQGRGGGGGNGHGAGPGGMGAGPPMSVPGRSADARGTARDIANQRGQFGRDFAEQRRMTQAEQAQLYRDRLNAYRGASDARRADALARAEAARAGRGSKADARAALKRDMEEWRDAFQIGRSDWQAQRDQWLLDRDTLTPEQWTQRRADWFAARDAWIARQKAFAQATRTN